MNEWIGPDAEPTLASLRREFCGWECWRGVSGLYYGRRPGRRDGNAYDAEGEDARDLRDQIIRWKWLNDNDEGACPGLDLV
jgi:hypothetical protein